MKLYKKFDSFDFKKLRQPKNSGILFSIDIDDPSRPNDTRGWSLHICPYNDESHEHYLLNLQQTKKLKILIDQILFEEKKIKNKRMK